MPDLGDRIKHCREKLGLTQKELAKKADLSVVQLSRYETNARKPDPDALKQLADSLDVSVDYLLGRAHTGGVSFLGGPDEYTKEEIEYAKESIRTLRETLRKMREENGD